MFNRLFVGGLRNTTMRGLDNYWTIYLLLNRFCNICPSPDVLVIHDFFFDKQLLLGFFFADATILSAFDSAISFLIFLITEFFSGCFHVGLYTFMHRLKITDAIS